VALGSFQKSLGLGHREHLALFGVDRHRVQGVDRVPGHGLQLAGALEGCAENGAHQLRGPLAAALVVVA
jgi:hypothetical protein